MKYTGLFFLLFLLTPFAPLLAQQSELDNANVFFESSLLKDAIPLYEKVLARNPHDVNTAWKLAECYRYTLQPEKAAARYAELLKKEQRPEYLYSFGQTLKMLGRYAEAKQQFSLLAKKDEQRGKHFIETCNFAEKKGKTIFQATLMPALSSKSADFAPTFYKDQLLFSSSRSVAIQKDGKVTWTNDAFNQYYLALRDPLTDSILEVKPLRTVVGRDINDAPMSYTRTGERVAISSNNYMDGIRHINGSGLMMDIYVYETKAMHEWKLETEEFFPHNARVESDEPFSTGHPAFSPDGKALYFSSNRKGGMGGYDIYVCYKTERGWTEPQNLGYPINTPGDELSPFIDETGRLFFSSDWHPGYGGMDVFTAERFAYGWGNVQNLGPELNSSYDELYFIYDPRRKLGYLSSNRLGGMGYEDIYKAKLLGEFPKYQPELVQTGHKLRFEDDIYDYQNTIVAPQDTSWYALLKLLGDNPRSVVQINVHTDSRGLAKSNLSLSQKRAANFAEFLHSKGVHRKRILYEGYGDKFLVNHCKAKVNCSEAEHRENRRTELFFVGQLDAQEQVVIQFNASPDPKQNPNSLAAVEPAPTPPTSISGSNNPNNPGERAKIYTPEPDNEPEPSPEPSRAKPKAKSSYKAGEKIELCQVFYAHDKTEVDEKRSTGLNDLVKLLQTQKELVIEIGSHTDSRGKSSYNSKLSQDRANGMKRYLIRKGIAADRLVAKGYGETKLLNKCRDGVKCSKWQHAQNRRTEFTVLSKNAPTKAPSRSANTKTAKKGSYKVGEIIEVAGIQYEFDKDAVDVRNSPGLKEIIDILKSSTIVVEIRAHTDSRGKADYNLKLSQRRAKAMYEYLIKQGVPAKRLYYKGYGESQLLNKCKDGVNCSDEEHARNRRTDFKVVRLK